MDFDEKEEERPAIEAAEIPNTSSDLSEVDKLDIAKSLGIETISELEKIGDHLERLAEWTKAKGAVDKVDMLGMIKQLTTRLGEKNLTNLSLYAYLELERMKLETKMRRLESNGTTKEN